MSFKSANRAMWTVWVVACITVALIIILAIRNIAIAAPPTWYMPAGTRRLVACDGARLVAHPIDGTNVLLYCLASESPLPTPLPPRP